MGIKNILKKLYDKLSIISNDNDKYFIIGMPQSGKTVFFVTMMQYLMLIQKQIKKIDISPVDSNSNNFVSNNINSFLSSDNQWIDKTMKGGIYKYKINYKRFFHNTEVVVEYFDYPGEVFIKAFHPEIRGQYAEFSDQANSLKNEIASSKGIFILIDSIRLYEGFDSQMSSIVFEAIKTISRKSKVAIVFTKKDVFESYSDFNPYEKLRRMNPGIMNKLEMDIDNFETFFISSVKTELKDGERVPPDDYCPTVNSENLLQPIKWMLELEENTLERIKSSLITIANNASSGLVNRHEFKDV